MKLLTVAVLLCGCGDVERQLQLVPVRPDCVPAGINSVQVLSLGDFPPAPARVSATGRMGTTSLNLPGGTRVLEIDGLGAAGLLAFGRTAPFDLSDLGPRVALDYGPPDSLCATADMSYARAGHQATLLPSGSVLLSGGHDDTGFAVRKLELYVPFGDDTSPPGTFRVVDPNGTTALDPQAALGHAVAVLPGGDFLITGGAASSGGKPTGYGYQGYSHHSADGLQVGQAQVLAGSGRAFHTATVLADGRVVLIGGCARFEGADCASDGVLDDSVVYNSGSWTVGPKLLHGRWGHQALLRADGKILIVGGGPAELFDVVAGGSDAGTLSGATALLPTGAALAVDSHDTTLWVDGDPVALAPLPSVRTGHTVTVLDDGSALVAGGGDPTLVLYDPVLGPRTLAGPFLRHEHTATRLGDGAVLLAGGGETSGASVHASIFLHSPLGPFSNIATLTFDTPDVPVVPRRPDRLRLASGQLELTAAAPADGRRPAEFALVAALDLNELSLSAVAGSDGGAAILLGWQSDARYAFVTLTPNAPVTLSIVRDGAVTVPCPGGETLTADELPDPAGPLAPITVNWRSGHFEVFTPSRLLLQCTPGDALGRGAAGLGVIEGRAVFDDVSLTR